MRRKTIALFCLAFGLAASASAGGPGTTGADILKVTLGARPAALGGAYGAVGGDVQAVLFNPAALATVSAPDAVFQHYIGLEEICYELLGYGQPVKGLGVVGGAVAWRHMPSIDNPGAPDDPVLANDVVAAFGLSSGLENILGRIGRGWSVGAAGKIIYSSLREAHAVGAALDAGVFWTERVFAVPVAFSAAVQNAGTSLTFIEAADPLPLTGRLGASAQYPSAGPHRGLLAAEWSYTRESGAQTSLGAEYALADLLFVRAGYVWMGADNLGGPAAGLGVAFNTGAFRARMDYTYRPQLWNGWDSIASNHLLSLGASF